jgi:hypothetical protein
MNGGLGEVIGLLVALPFAAFADWFKFIKQLPPGQQELAKACHGVGMLALLAYWFRFAGGFGEFVDGLTLRPGELLHWIPLIMAVWGLGWFLLHARFAAQAVGRPHRAAMIVRGLLKIAAGWAIWAYAGSADLPVRAGGSAGWGLLMLALHVVAVWCLATGGTKALLMIWGGPRGEAYPMVAGDIAANEFDWNDEARR